MTDLLYAEEAERSVIGSVLIDPGAFDRVSHLVDPDDFGSDRLRTIWNALCAMNGVGVDLLTLRMRLEQEGALDRVGGSTALAELVDGIPDIGNAPHYAKAVRSAAQRRKIVYECQRLQIAAQSANDEEVNSVASEAQLVLGEASSFERAFGMGPLMKEAMNDLEKRMESKDSITGVATGYRQIDDLLLGWQRGMKIVVGARPSVGKSAVALNFAWNAAKRGARVLYFNVEMITGTLMARLIALESGVWASKVRSGQFIEKHELEAITAATGRIARVGNGFIVNSRPNISVAEIRSEIRRGSANAPLDLVVIDYLQIVSGGEARGNDRERLDWLSGQTLSFAKEFSCAVIEMAQLNREATGRPNLMNFRGSDKLVQDASVVMLLDRPGRRGEEEPECKLLAIVDKNREGEAGKDLVFHYNLDTQEVSEEGHCYRCKKDGGPRLPIREERTWSQSEMVQN